MPMLIKPRPSISVRNIGLKRINIMPRYPQRTVKLIARRINRIYVARKRKIEKIARMVEFLKLRETWTCFEAI
jgi:hypothetical protein